MDDSVRHAAGCQVLLRLALPLQDVALPQLVEHVLRVGAAHGAHQDDLLHTGGFGGINLQLLADPVDLLQGSMRVSGPRVVVVVVVVGGG